ncbi:hypothetical protein ACB092_10G143700 [Castanea dentata]
MNEIGTLKQSLKALQKNQPLENTSYQSNEEGPSDNEEEIRYKKVEDQLTCKTLQEEIRKFEEKLKQEVCSDLPTAFWHRKRHEIALPYVKDFNEKDIPTKARPIQMNQELMDTCRTEIEDLLKKGIIRKSRSPWSCPAFYPSYPTRRGNSSYVKKSFPQHISYIEPYLGHITDPLALAMEVLPHEWHFLPKHPEKNIRFHKSILSQEKSVQIENIFNSRDPSVVLYHKFIITGFVSCQDWGQHPSDLKILKNYRSPSGSTLYYSYYDYMDAFEKVLFIQNKNFRHSWFMIFSREFIGQLPSWFLRWWEMFGSVPQIFPDSLQDALRYFDSRYKTSSHRSQFPYKINTNLLDREFLVKWWDGLRIEQIINQQPIAHRTRSQSSLDSVQIARKSRKELKELAHQLIAHSQQLESEEQVSPTASVASVNHNPIDPFQDSQDPYSGYNLDSD